MLVGVLGQARRGLACLGERSGSELYAVSRDVDKVIRYMTDNS